MKITADSHTDHALSPAHVAFVLARFGDREEFFAETVELPGELPGLPCGLHGPAVGDSPIPDAECRGVVRGSRKGPSRVCDRAPKPSRQVTVIGGKHDGECILFTAYGGPLAPREPWDLDHADPRRETSAAFWAEHALSAEAAK